MLATKLSWINVYFVLLMFLTLGNSYFLIPFDFDCEGKDSACQSTPSWIEETDYTLIHYLD